MDDLLTEFLAETNESLGTLDNELLKLESNPNDEKTIGSIFRMVHTVKGTCGFLGLSRLEKLAHAGENVLGKFRDKALEVTPDAVTLILECLDQIKSIVTDLGNTGAEPQGGDQELIDRLNAMAEGRFVPKGGAAAAPAADAGAMDEAELAARVAALMAEDAEITGKSGSVVLSEAKPAAAPVAAPVVAPVAAPAPVVADEKAAEPAKAGEPVKVVESVRVNIDLLEYLMNSVSELVLTRNQLLQILRVQKDSEFATSLQRLNLIVSEIQDGVMKTRMQPIGNAWGKLPRIIRDLSNELAKKIDLKMSGEETELDRQVSELIRDPLTHMVRNSADHGIEMPADRLAAGKPETGTIRLDAFHEGGHIIIKIADDGKGLSTARIKQKIIQNNLASEAELAAMTDQQVHQYIFRAGFSTAEKVTSVSGRGVGMDVVRTNIEKIGGTIELLSIEGKGSTFTIKIPLTLAIVSSLILQCAGQRFAIPQLSVVELVMARADDSDHRIEYINGTPIYRLRNRLLPLVSLQALLKLPAKTDGVENRNGVIVVTQVGKYQFGIIVDQVLDQEEIVVKPISPVLRHISMFSGNTILGDGNVVMILDPNGIAAATGEITVADSNAESEADRLRALQDSDTTSFLLFRAGGVAPKAVPLRLVARLEDVDMTTVEYSDGTPVLQYRGRLMPLLAMQGVDIPVGQAINRPILVFADGDHAMGMVAEEILDIVEAKLDIQMGATHEGLLGSAVLEGKTTDIIDVAHYLTKAFQDWFGGSHGVGVIQSIQKTKEGRRVLLIDDSQFFRNLLSPLLTMAGYEVTTVENATDALDMCESGMEFDIIVSDIEMPGMNGYQFAEKLRTLAKWETTPLVALSAHSSPKDLERGREAGFSDYVPKHDREALLETLSHALEMKGVA